MAENNKPWWIWDKKAEADKTQQEYIQSQKDVASEYQKQADEIDWNKVNQEAAGQVDDISQMKADLAESKQPTTEQPKMAAATEKAEIQTPDKLEERRKAVKQLQEQKDLRNKQIIAAKQFASEQAKLKYELAAQDYSQSVANIQNTIKTLTTFGIQIGKLL